MTILLASFIFYLLPWTVTLYAAVPDGYVVKVDSTTVYLDWGKSSGVQMGDSFKVYRAGEPLKHPVTGEILGQTEMDLGQGVLDHLEEKFSTGKLVEIKGDIKPGDRTRHIESAETQVPVAESSPSSAPAIVPKELWRSEALEHEATGLAIGDVVGDGKKEVVVAFRDQIEIFQWNGRTLESLTSYKSRSYTNYLAVETGDIDGAGRDKIFASLFVEGVKRSRTIVLEYSSGTLHEVGRLDGFVRALEGADGKRELVSQDLSLARELRVRQPALVAKTANGFREGKMLKFQRSLNDDQLFGYTWGDWDGDGSEDFAMLQQGERLRLFLQNAAWSSSESYGGTKADFGWENDQMGSLYPRLLNVKTSAGKTQLLVPHNIPYTPIRMARLKIFKEAEIVDVSWNGLEMAPVWKLPISGELADFGMGDVLQNGKPQLWVAAVGAGDKTVLLAYQIP
jgi:hypothetical protein